MRKSNLMIPALDAMAEGYKRQLSKYQAMLKLAEKQKEYAEVDDRVKLEEVILARQSLIQDLEEMNSKLRPLREDIVSTLGLKEFSSTALLEVLSIEVTENLSDVLVELGEVLYAIKELDRINEKILREKLFQTNQKIKIREKNIKGVNPYKKKKEINSPKYVDENK